MAKKNKIKLPLFMDGKMCPYCGDESQLVDDEEIYAKSYGGKCYVCWPCVAWVGCHTGTKKALGRLANKELRQAKIEAHAHFDLLWKKKQRVARTKYGKNNARSLAYKWLSEKMGTPPLITHIGMFNVEQCQQVVKLCKPYIR